MKLHINKVNQGPVLAKGTVAVTDSTSCGYVSPNGVSNAGCSTTTSSSGTVTYGVGPQNGGNAQVQYTNSNCC